MSQEERGAGFVPARSEGIMKYGQFVQKQLRNFILFVNILLEVSDL